MEPCEIDEHLLNRRLRQYVIFTGLDLANNAQHAAIYAEFTNEARHGALLINYGFLTPDHEFFRRAASITASSFNQGALSLASDDAQKSAVGLISGGGLRRVGGILKRAWPLKYLRQRPALIVCFVDVDWDETTWPEKKTECESKINSLRQSLGHRDARMALVLVTRVSSGVPLPSQATMADKKLEICAQCKLPTKNVFVLSSTSSVRSSAPSLQVGATSADASAGNSVPLALPKGFAEGISRCELAFHDIAQEAYMHFLKKIRARSVANNDARLLIRQQYKLAFISELRQDVHSALRYYKTAYQNVAELEPSSFSADGDAYETLAVAGLLNFKVCELCFVLNSANDAIAQFHRHQKLFFHCSLLGSTSGIAPSRELAAIEAAWWKSQQCRLFAELFERAVTGGLAAYAFQNPGRFLDEAATFYKSANALIRQLREERTNTSTRSSPAFDASQTIDLNGNHTTFYGQRPWRDTEDFVAAGSNVVASQLTEHAAKLALEQNVRENYQRSLQLWSQAVAQFKRYNCEGAQNAALIHMSDDYVQLHKLGTALQLLHRVGCEFQARNLRHLLRHILLKYLRIAYCMVNLNEYVWALVQLLNPMLDEYERENESDDSGAIAARTEDDDKMDAVAVSAHEFFARRFGVPPAAPESIDTPITQATYSLATVQWQQYYNHSVQVSFSVELSRLDAFLQCRARFLHPAHEHFYAGEVLPVQVQVRNVSRFSITLDKCVLTLEEVGSPNGKTNTNVLDSISISYANSASDEQASSHASKNGRFELRGNGSVATFFFAFRPRVDGLSVKEKQILIRKVSLRVIGGDDSKTNACFDFEMGAGTTSSRASKWITRWNHMSHSFRVLPQKRSLRLVGPIECINLLVEEIVSVPFAFTNNESVPLKCIKIIGHQIYREDASPEAVFVPVYLQEFAEPLNHGETINLQLRLSSKSKNCVGIQMQVTCQTVGDASDDATGGVGCEGVEVTQTFDVNCTEPFTINTSVFAVNGDTATSLVPGQRVMVEAAVLIEAPISIQSIKWNLNPGVCTLTESGGDSKQPNDVKTGQRLVRSVSVSVPRSANAKMFGFGDVIVEWKSANSCDTVRNVISLGVHSLISVPLVVDARVISHADASQDEDVASSQLNIHDSEALVIRQPFLIEYRLSNASDVVLALNIALEHSDAFIFAGLTEFTVNLMLGEVYTTQVLTTALSTGQLPFPRLKICGANEASEKLIETHVHSSVPNTLYILP